MTANRFDAKKYNTEINPTASGTTNSILLTEGLWSMFANPGVSGSFNVEASNDNQDFFDLKKDDDTVLNFNSKDVRKVEGNIYLRLNVLTYVSGCSFVAKKIR